MVSGELKWWTAGTMEQGANRNMDGRRNWVYFKSVYQAPLYAVAYLLDKQTYEVLSQQQLIARIPFTFLVFDGCPGIIWYAGIQQGKS
jgi:hypothetical protein